MNSATMPPSPVDTPLPPPILVGDDPGLDLVNSRACPDGRCLEWLTDPEALNSWMTAAGLRDPTEQRPMLSRAEATAALERVLRLRNWLGAFLMRHSGSPLRDVSTDELALVNEELARDDGYEQVVANTGGIGLRGPTYRRPQEAIVQPLARVVASLLCTADFSRIRKCESKDCTLWFLDKTKGGTRRWCSMAICGNRAKARAHRARR